ncbi:hypothetical protein N018_13355 [Pseudomonas syringae CC1557]|uniref:Uncharacterized protein n=1 Tax=Pseudomonas syringae CC1557 TaxID=1357279 RepID=W0MYF3_PSESX|nr:hypothetical protein [Pseudomonas syringae]AHG43614.1 hypothetical protein N018_13355 [Pseudomonas syringae CC1557]
MSQPEISTEHAIAQLTSLVLALAHTQAASSPDHAAARIGAAIYACREQGVGDYYPLQVFNKVFPGKNLPIVLTDEEFAAKQAESKI